MLAPVGPTAAEPLRQMADRPVPAERIHLHLETTLGKLAQDNVPGLKLLHSAANPMISSSVLSVNAFATPLLNGLFSKHAQRLDPFSTLLSTFYRPLMCPPPRDPQKKCRHLSG